MRKNKILIISYYWPPSGGSGVQRWLNFSNHLTKIGWDVTVLTAKNPNYPIEDKSLCGNINKSLEQLLVPIFEPTVFFNHKKTAINTNSNGIININLIPLLEGIVEYLKEGEKVKIFGVGIMVMLLDKFIINS